MQQIFIKIFVFVFGAFIGSFLNVCIYRMPRELSIKKPARSFCPNCKKTIYWYDNVPILSFIFLKRRCRFCQAKISWRYPIVELITALAFVILLNYFGLSWKIFVYAIFISCLTVAIFTDLDFRIIPDEISVGGIIIGIVFSLFGFVPDNNIQSFYEIFLSIFGALVGFGLFALIGIIYFSCVELLKRKNTEQEEPQSEIFWYLFLLIGLILGWNLFHFVLPLFKNLSFYISSFVSAIIGASVGAGILCFVAIFGDFLIFNVGDFISQKLFKKEIYLKKEFAEGEEPSTMGFGDVKLLAMVGAFLGWQQALLTLFLACILGGIVGIIVKIKTKGSLIPFGPFIAIAAVISLFFSNQLIAKFYSLYYF